MPDRNGGRTQRSVLIWDLPTRLFHWLLALALAGSWATHELGLEWTEAHIWLGYLTLGLVAFRILWGFAGPRHARFASFLTGPAAVADYARGWLTGTPSRHAGHNPLGGWAVMAMLAAVLVQGVSGLFNSDDIMHSGPWHWAAPTDLAGFMGEVHAVNFNLLAGLVVVHLAAIAGYWLRWRIDLLRPMLSGRKSSREVDSRAAIPGSRLGAALIVAALAAGAIWLVVSLAPTPTVEDFF